MPVHNIVTPSIKFAGTHLYTCKKRGTVRVKCLAQEHNTVLRPGLEPRLLDMKFSALTIRPPYLPDLQLQDSNVLQLTSTTAIYFQDKEKKLTYPWALAKGFDTATPVSVFIPRSEIPDPDNVRLWSKIDGKMQQDGNTQDMIYKIPHLISFISQYMTLEEGDLLLTGTPEGNSPVRKGQTIVCGLGDKIEMTFPIS